jgi:hypothetical protein
MGCFLLAQILRGQLETAVLTQLLRQRFGRVFLISDKRGRFGQQRPGLDPEQFCRHDQEIGQRIALGVIHGFLQLPQVLQVLTSDLPQ